MNRLGPISITTEVSSKTECKRLRKLNTPNTSFRGICPVATSFISKPPPNPKPKVTPTTAIVAALSPTPINFKKGFRVRRISRSTPITRKNSRKKSNTIMTSWTKISPLTWSIPQSIRLVLWVNCGRETNASAASQPVACKK